MENIKDQKIYIAGHSGMVGSAVLRRLTEVGCHKIITRRSEELDLRNQAAVEEFMRRNKPDLVVIAAAKVGGILANNTYRAEFIYDNLMIEANLIHASYKSGVQKLIFLGSSCIYPKMAPQPIKEEYLLSGPLEPTNEPYAVAKIAGIKLCENYYRQYGCNFYSVMPTNLYGPNDNFNLETAHVLPALIRKFDEAKIKKEGEVQLWGTGKPKREFLFVNDLAEAIVFLLEKIDAKQLYDGGISHLNIGTGKDVNIAELAKLIKKIVGFEGDIVYDTSKPDGTPRKLLDVSRIHKLGWHHKIELEKGISMTYDWYLKNKDRIKK